MEFPRCAESSSCTCPLPVLRNTSDADVSWRKEYKFATRDQDDFRRFFWWVDGQPALVVVVGYSHQRVMVEGLSLMLDELGPGKYEVRPHLSDSVCLFVPRNALRPRRKYSKLDTTDVLVAVFHSTAQPAGDVATRVGALLGDCLDAARRQVSTRPAAVVGDAKVVVVGRGMWDAEHGDDGLEFVRRTHAATLLRARAAFPAAAIFTYPTHYSHTAHDGCTDELRQVMFRDAVMCAVAAANRMLFGAAAPFATLAVDSRAFRVFDAFGMTASRLVRPSAFTPKEPTPTGLPAHMDVGDGHHFRDETMYAAWWTLAALVGALDFDAKLLRATRLRRSQLRRTLPSHIDGSPTAAARFGEYAPYQARSGVCRRCMDNTDYRPFFFSLRCCEIRLRRVAASAALDSVFHATSGNSTAALDAADDAWFLEPYPEAQTVSLIGTAKAQYEELVHGDIAAEGSVRYKNLQDHVTRTAATPDQNADAPRS